MNADQETAFASSFEYAPPVFTWLPGKTPEPYIALYDTPKLVRQLSHVIAAHTCM